MSTRLLIVSIFSSCLLSAASAGDIVVVAGESSTYAYHFNSGHALHGNPWTMPDTIVDMERFLGGGSVYTVDQGGNTSRTRIGPMVSTLSPQPHTLGALDMAYDPIGRKLISVEGTMVVRYLEDEWLHSRGYTQYHSQGGFTDQEFHRVELTPDGQRRFVCEPYRLHEIESTTANTGLLVNQIWTSDRIDHVAISKDSKYFVLLTNSTAKTGTRILIYDLQLNILCVSYVFPLKGAELTGVAFDKNDSSRLFVGSTLGLHRFQLAEGLNPMYPNLLRYHDVRAQPVLDLTWNDDTELFVLHGSAAGPSAPREVARYTIGLIHSGSIIVPDTRQLLVVPEPQPNQYLVSLLRPEWLGLLEALEWTGWKLPLGWHLTGDEILGGKENPEQVKSAAKRAASWLSTLGGKASHLDPTQVLEFLSAAKGSSPSSAGLFLDLILLGEPQAGE